MCWNSSIDSWNPVSIWSHLFYGETLSLMSDLLVIMSNYHVGIVMSLWNNHWMFLWSRETCVFQFSSHLEDSILIKKSIQMIQFTLRWKLSSLTREPYLLGIYLFLLISYNGTLSILPLLYSAVTCWLITLDTTDKSCDSLGDLIPWEKFWQGV